LGVTSKKASGLMPGGRDFFSTLKKKHGRVFLSRGGSHPTATWKEQKEGKKPPIPIPRQLNRRRIQFKASAKKRQDIEIDHRKAFAERNRGTRRDLLLKKSSNS